MEYLCAYGNCEERVKGNAISISRHGHTQRFCGELHGALWLMQRAENVNLSNISGIIDRAKAQSASARKAAPTTPR